MSPWMLVQISCPRSVSASGAFQWLSFMHCSVALSVLTGALWCHKPVPCAPLFPALLKLSHGFSDPCARFYSRKRKAGAQDNRPPFRSALPAMTGLFDVDRVKPESAVEVLLNR